MNKNSLAFSFYGIMLLGLLIWMLPACGQDKTVTIDSSQCYSVEIVNRIGEHILVPISQIETMQYNDLDGWFIWKTDNTGYWNVEVIGYGKSEGCQ